MSHEDSQMMKILETIADRLVDMHLANQRQFAELAAQIEARLPAKVGEQLSLLAIVTAPEAVVPNEDEAMPVVEPVIVQDEPSPRKNVRLRMPPEVRALSQGATKLAREGQALIKQAMDNASANSGRMSLDDKKLLDAGTVKMTESKKLQSQYNSQRERITYPNGRK